MKFQIQFWFNTSHSVPSHTQCETSKVFHRFCPIYLSRHTAAYNQYQILNMSYPFPTYSPSRYGKYSFAMFKHNIGRFIKRKDLRLKFLIALFFSTSFEMRQALVKWLWKFPALSFQIFQIYCLHRHTIWIFVSYPVKITQLLFV